MDAIFATARTAAVIFAGTNIDDLIMLTVLFLCSAAGGQPKVWQIWAGQYAGMGVLVAVSAAAAIGLLIVPQAWVGLLGLLPLALGVHRLITVVRGPATARRVQALPSGLLPVMGLTIGNGGDNISVYTPVFRSIGGAAAGLTVAVFAVGVAMWCLAASRLGAHKKIVEIVERYGRWIVPAVYIIIGGAIIAESGIAGRLMP